MATCVITAYARGDVRTLAEITTVLAHRDVQPTSFTSSFADDRWRIDVMVAVSSQHAVDLLAKRLNRIVNVTKVLVQRDEESHYRTCLLAAVNARTSEARRELLDILNAYDAEVVELTSRSITLAYSGPPERVQNLMSLLSEYGSLGTNISNTVSVHRVRPIAAEHDELRSAVSA